MRHGTPNNINHNNLVTNSLTVMEHEAQSSTLTADIGPLLKDNSAKSVTHSVPLPGQRVTHPLADSASRQAA